MRKLAVFAVLSAACTGHVGDEIIEAHAPEALEEVEPDPQPGPGAVAVDGLELVLDYDGKRRVEPGVYLSPRWTLRNTSDASRHYVEPGDGSSVGWREPHVYYTAQHSTDGETWTDVEVGDLGRCGLYDHEWQDEIAELAPGESAELPWTPEPAWQLRLQRPGEVRLWAHYEFSAGTGFGNTRGASEYLAEMEGVSAFHLVSAPVELEIVRPLDLVLEPTAHAGRAGKLSQAFTLTLENRGASERSVPAPNSTNVRVVARNGADQSTLFDPDWELHDREAELELASGAVVQILGRQVDFAIPAQLWSEDLEINVRLDLGSAAGHLETGWVGVGGG